MPLTARQRLWAISPYRVSVHDLDFLMRTLSDPNEWSAFGDEYPGVLRMVGHAALNQNMKIPYTYQQVLDKINDPNNQGRVTNHSWTGEISGKER